MRNKITVSLMFFIAFLCGVSGQAQKAQFGIVKTFHIASAGGWDYIAVCPYNDNLYVAHGNQVNILNRISGDSVGVILHTEGVHGIAFAPEVKKGFITNGKTNNVTVFNMETGVSEILIKTGEKPDAVMYDAVSKKIIVCNGKSNDLNIIDPTNLTVAATIAVDGKPETAVTDENGTIFVNLEDKNEVVVVNPKTHAVEHRWKIGKGEEPTGLAIDTKTHRLFAGCGNKWMIVLDANSGKVIAELPIGDGCDGVSFDEATKLIYCAAGEGKLSVYKEKSASKFVLEGHYPSKKGARTIDIDKKSHLVYLPTAEFEAPKPDQKRPSMIPGTFQVLVMGNK
jgi:YVTN family beta-propeller protein